MKMLGKSSLSSKLKLLIDFAWYGTLLATALLVLAVPFGMWVASQPSDGRGTVTLSLDEIGFRLVSDTATLRSADGGTAVLSKGVGSVDIGGALDTYLVLVGASAVAVQLAILLFMIWQLRRLFRTFTNGQPFARENVRRLRTIGVGIVGLTLASTVFGALITHLISRRFESDAVQFVVNVDVSGTSLFAAAVVFVLAEIFHLGKQLEEEQALTV